MGKSSYKSFLIRDCCEYGTTIPPLLVKITHEFSDTVPARFYWASLIPFIFPGSQKPV